jgi:hypothetical protein
MLNETWRLWQALERTKIAPPPQHPLIKPLPGSVKFVLRVRLAQNGSVSEVEEISIDDRSALWRIVQTSDGSFPVVAVNQPVLQAAGTKKDSLKDLSSSLETCTHYLAYKQDWPWADARQKAATLLRKLRNKNEDRRFVQFTRCFGRASRNPGRLRAEISKIGLDKIRQGKLESIREIGELLIGPKASKSGKQGKMSVMLVFDLEDDKNSIYGPSIRSLIMDALPTNLKKDRQIRAPRKQKPPEGHSANRSAFGGNGTLLEEPFPQVKLPVLGGYFPLISMHSDGQAAKCNKRYGLTECTVFPVTSSQSRNMHDALTWLVTREEGTTWRGVASGKCEMDPRTHKKKEKRDLLIAYVDEMPELDAKTASYFGSGAEITAAQFEVDSKAVCDALSSVVQEHPKSKLNLFLIRKASDGQAQIALAESIPVKLILQTAERWQRAARGNVPHITLYLPRITIRNKTLPAVEEATPLTPYPEQVVRLLSNQWVRDGASPKGLTGKPQKASQEVIGPGLGEVLALMLRTEGRWESVARKILNLLMRRIMPLLIGVFGAKHAYGPRRSQGKQEPLADYPRESREAALRAVAVIGILLDALESRKEGYMKDAPYMVGQVLALADTLHKDYCVVVRKDQLPNSLIGTSLMRRALDNPAGALADLSERMIEYVRWAKTAHADQDWAQEDQKRIAINEARKKLRQYQPLAAELARLDLPIECNDLMKAQLLLGFLASPPSEEQNNKGKDEN